MVFVTDRHKSTPNLRYPMQTATDFAFRSACKHAHLVFLRLQIEFTTPSDEVWRCIVLFFLLLFLLGLAGLLGLQHTISGEDTTRVRESERNESKKASPSP